MGVLKNNQLLRTDKQNAIIMQQKKLSIKYPLEFKKKRIVASSKQHRRYGFKLHQNPFLQIQKRQIAITTIDIKVLIRISCHASLCNKKPTTLQNLYHNNSCFAMPGKPIERNSKLKSHTQSSKRHKAAKKLQGRKQSANQNKSSQKS